MVKADKFIAIDLGASSGRVILGTLKNSKLELTEIHRFSNDPVEICGEFHWDILRLFHEIKVGLVKCANAGHKDIKSISVDTWGVDYGFLDENGKLIGNPFHYRDSRTNNYVDKLDEVISKEELYNITGIQFMNLNTIYQLYSAVVNKSAELKHAKHLLFIPDLLNYFLCGEMACEYSIASTSALLDARTREISNELLRKIGIDKGLFKNIVKSGTIIGKLKEDISLETGIGQVPVIATASHDTASALVSVPTLSNNFAFLSSGTWSLMGIESDEPIINHETLEMLFTNEGGAEYKIKFLKNIMGMWLIQECKRHWERKGTPYSYDELDKMAQESQPFYCFINPDDESFVAPGNMPYKIREYCKKTGQNIPETDAQVIRCIYDSLALRYKLVFENIEKIKKQKLDVLHIVGGGIKNKPLCQMTADAIGKKVITGPIEATSMGNIMVQALGLGIVKSLDEIREIVKNSTHITEYKPQQNLNWSEAYERYLKVTK